MKYILFLSAILIAGLRLAAQPAKPEHSPSLPSNPLHFDSLLYGAAYYYEYMPQERLARNVQLMKEAGINTVRIAESTWSVWEPRDGIFDFSKLDKVLDALEKAGIHVIIGTPTYAIPAWLAREHPEVLVTTGTGRRPYGARQNMDIVSPVFRRYAERIIRKLVAHVRERHCVIGYQADNETKFYQNTGAPMQALFVRWLQQKFGSPEKMNRAYGLNYWSNSIHDWKDFPPMTGNINASLGSAFSFFRRKMVTGYLAWQVGLIRKLKRPDQFITHNFDLEWRGYSYGIQPDVDHFDAARAFDIAGIDIYHPTADRLTGTEISFGGDLARGMKRANYLVLETQAQSLAGRQELPYPGQLRLQAFSHLASGANMVEYWPWQSLPNAVETYWKGVLSHDGEKNPFYEEVKQIGADFRQSGDHLVNLQKKNKVALLFSNESLTALDWFPFSDSLNYNDILRQEYDALYAMNIGCDLVNTSSTNLSDYALLVIPPLYSVSDSTLSVLNDYVRRGGHIVYSCKSGFTDENVQVRSSRLPGLLREATGLSYQLFTNTGHLPLKEDPFHVGAAANEVHEWMEFLVPETARVLASYDHPIWGKYAAITKNNYGSGTVTYLGTLPSRELLRQLLAIAVKEAGAGSIDQQLSFPLIVKSGINRYGKVIHYYFNYSAQPQNFVYPYADAANLLADRNTSLTDTPAFIKKDQPITLEPWGLLLLEEAIAGKPLSGKTDAKTSKPGNAVSVASASCKTVLADPGPNWLDTDGDPIDAHGAGILFHDGIYYLYGERKKGKTRLVPGQDWEDYRVDAGGVSCYSSRDLVNWKKEGVALPSDRIDTASDLHISRVIERPKVIYNRKTRKFVLWMHIDKDDYSYARAGVAVSDHPQGPFHYLGSVRPNGQMSRDMTLFQDDDGKAYLVYTSENNNTMQICLLSDDYLSPTTTYKRILINQRREAPAIFKHSGRYYLITSLCSGWDPNPATYATSTTMLGEWRQIGNPCVGEDSATTFHSQSTFVLTLNKADGSFLFLADRWNKTDLEQSGYLWLPLQVSQGHVIIRNDAKDDQDKTNKDTAFSSQLSGWTVYEDPGALTADTAQTARGNLKAHIGVAAGGLFRRIEASPLSLVSYNFQVRPATKEGYHFIRFYNGADSLLLEYKSPMTFSEKIESAGNYTEVPPDTRYMTIGIGKEACEGYLTLQDFQFDLNIGNPASPHAPRCDLGQYLRPFWNTDTIFNETVLLYSAGGQAAGGRLLYNPDKILSVSNYGLDTLYRKGTDYTLQGRNLIRTSRSRMPLRTDSSFDTKNNLAWYDLQSGWVVVTYTHHDAWTGPVPRYRGDEMPGLLDKLQSGKPVKIVAYGMSITRGMDVSGYDQVAPYMPSYMELFAKGLREQYPRSAITLYNAGLPGSSVSWGAAYAEQYVNPLQPDLVVLDFGMNDFWRMPPEEFRDSIKTILRKVRSANPDAGFLLLANMKFDPDYVLDSDSNKAFYTGNLAGYQRMLQGLETRGIIGLDMTNLSDAIYRRKKAKDCIVNPLHPNDYLARWYAQGMLALFKSMP